MRGGSRGRDSAASLEQADALLFAAATSGGVRGGAPTANAAAAAWQKQKLRYGGDSPAAASASFSAESETSVAVAVLGLLFGLSLCGCIFFLFLSVLFLCALDTFSLPLATKRAAGRACLAAALLHLASLVVLGTLLHQQHPEQALRRMRSLLLNLGKRGGRAILTNGGYLLIRGTRAARDCWLRVTHADVAAAGASGSGSTGIRNRSSGSAAAALAGGVAQLPYCSRGAGCSSSRDRPPNHSLHADAGDSDYVAASHTKTRLTRGQLQQEHAGALGCHNASYAPLASSLPPAVAAGPSSYAWNTRSASSSPSNTWDGPYTTAAIGGAAAASGHSGDTSGGATVGKTPSLCVLSGSSSERSTRTRDSSLDSSAANRRSGGATEAVAYSVAKNPPADSLLLLASPSPKSSHVSANSVPAVFGLPPTAVAACATPATAAVRSAVATGPLLQPAAVCWTLPVAVCSDDRAPPGTHVEEKRVVKKQLEGSPGLGYRSSDTNSSSRYDVLRTQGVTGTVDVLSSSGVNSRSNSHSPRDTHSGYCNRDGVGGLWSNNCADQFQQQQVSPLLQQAEQKQQQQAIQHLLQHSLGQQHPLHQGQTQCTLQEPQVQKVVQQQRAHQMLHQQPFRQQQHAQMHFSQVGLLNLQQNSYAAAASTGQDQSVTPGLRLPAENAAHTSNSSYLPAAPEVFPATRKVATHKFIGESERPFEPVPR